MATQPQTKAEEVRALPEAPGWRLRTRIAFRFCCVYFGLYCLVTQIFGGMFPIPGVDFPDPSSFAPLRGVVFWTAAHVFHLKVPLLYAETGSGDRMFDWVLTFSVLAIAAFATGIWSVLDRQRPSYPGLYKWFYLVIRFALASEMVLYGMIKAVPMQMPFPFLSKLVEPFGNFSPMGVLWWSIGASPGYERFVGSAELLGGILLFIPRTTMLGALVCLADTIEIFTLNMTYDVPVKLLSFHLILMSGFLLAPEWPRILRFFFAEGAVAGSNRPQLFRSARANRIALWAQVVFGVLLLAGNGTAAWKRWYEFGGGAPKSPLYGIWDVDEYVKDGVVQPPLLSDKARPRRLLFDRPTVVTVQNMDDKFANYGAKIDMKAGSLALTKQSDKNWNANLRFERTTQDRLTVDGEMDRHRVRMQLQLADRSKLMLISRGFHWVSEFPLNR